LDVTDTATVVPSAEGAVHVDILIPKVGDGEKAITAYAPVYVLYPFTSR